MHRALAPCPARSHHRRRRSITGSPGSAKAGSSALRIGRIGVLDPITVFDVPLACLCSRGSRAGGYRHLAVATRNVEDIGWLAQPGDMAAERANETLASGDTGTEMRGAPCKIGMVEVVGLDAHRDETPKQGFQHGCIIV